MLCYRTSSPYISLTSISRLSLTALKAAMFHTNGFTVKHAKASLLPKTASNLHLLIFTRNVLLCPAFGDRLITKY